MLHHPLKILLLTEHHATTALVKRLLPDKQDRLDSASPFVLQTLAVHSYDLLLIDDVAYLSRLESYTDLPPLLLIGDVLPQAARELDGYPIGILPRADLSLPLLRYAIERALQVDRYRHAVRQRETRYSQILEDAADIICCYSPDYVLTFVNQAYCTFRGQSAQELLGKSFLPSMSSDYYQQFIASLEALTPENPFRSSEQHFVTAQGEERWMSWVDHAMFDAQRQLLEFHAFGRDVTELKVAQAQIATQADLLQRVNDAIIATDVEFRITSWNKAAELRYGWTEAEVLGQEISKVLQTEVVGGTTLEEARAVMKAREVWRGEFIHTAKDGHKINSQGQTANLYDANGVWVGIVVVNRDITEYKQAQAQIEYQANVLQAVQEAIIATDVDFHVTSWNQSAERMYGWTSEEAVGHELSELLHTVFIGQTRDDAVREIRFGKAWQGEVIHTAKDGHPIIVSSYAAPLYDFVGHRYGMVAVNRDITDFKQAQEQIAYQASLLNNVNDAIVATDLDFNITSWNPAAEMMYGWSAEEVKGKKLPEILEDQYSVSGYKKLIDELERSGNWRGEVLQHHRSGKVVHVFGSISYIKDPQGNPIGFIGINADITPIKNAERQRLELEAERTRVQILHEFLENTTHDLVTPLTSIKTSLYLLDRMLEGNDQPQRQLKNLEAQSSRLEKLLENMLNMSRLDEGENELHFVPTSINELLQELLSAKLGDVKSIRHSIALSLNPSLPSLLIDAPQMRRALDEIISNAILFTPEDGIIRLLTEQDNDEVIISVQDTGIGISEEDLPHIFERFYRGDKARNTKTGTSGLGLSIAQKIVELHGGRIEVESTLGKGSTFRIRLSLSSGQSSAPPQN